MPYHYPIAYQYIMPLKNTITQYIPYHISIYPVEVYSKYHISWQPGWSRHRLQRHIHALPRADGIRRQGVECHHRVLRCGAAVGQEGQRRGQEINVGKTKMLFEPKFGLVYLNVFWCIIRNMRDTFNRTAPHGGVRKRLNTVGLVDSSCVQRLNPLSISVN